MPLTTDWSNRHLIFSQPGSAEVLARVSQDPRFEQQLHRREQVLHVSPHMIDVSAEAIKALPIRTRKKNNGLWSIDLGTGASVGANNYPAKFSFNDTTADCTTDYVVYSTGLLGGVGQANIVGFNNLYSGCTGTVPNVNFAYNTAGQVLTSPLISRDGSQIAFVQTDTGQVGTLVLIRWAAGSGSIASPAVPTPLLPAQYLGCTAPCMTTIILRDSSNLITDDTTSSIFYDYTNDIAWIGGARGWLHKITGVFNGVPTEVNTGGFPVQVNPSNATALASPVYDRVSGNVFVGDAGGFLYSVNASTAAVVQSAQLDFGSGPKQTPIVNSTYNVLYFFSSSDGTANCPVISPAVACSAVFQLPTNFTAGATGTEVTVGDSLAYPGGTPNPLYIGGFDSAYYSSQNATGNLYVCGNTGGNGILYQLSINAGVMPANSSAITALAPGTSTAPCSAVADVANPSTSTGFTERLFVSVQNNGLSTACGSAGCLFNFISQPWKPKNGYTVGQQILDTNRNIETVITAGTSGASAPTWPTAPGTPKTDGTVTWINQTNLSATTLLGWAAGKHYSHATDRILDSLGNIEVSTTPGFAGSTAPSWNPVPGGTTPDNGIVWTNAGPVSTLALSVPGGTSGIIIDNTVIGSLAGTSQIYFSTLTDQVACGTSGAGGCAMQASQPGLN